MGRQVAVVIVVGRTGATGWCGACWCGFRLGIAGQAGEAEASRDGDVVGASYPQHAARELSGLFTGEEAETGFSGLAWVFESSAWYRDAAVVGEGCRRIGHGLSSYHPLRPLSAHDGPALGRRLGEAGTYPPCRQKVVR
jgi:hypothetical protein